MIAADAVEKITVPSFGSRRPTRPPHPPASGTRTPAKAVAVLKARCGDHPHRFDFSSERTFGLAGFCTLRILTRRHGEAADLRILIADWNQLGVLACLPFLHIIERFPSGNDETIGSIPAQFRDFIRADDETATGGLDGFDCLAREFVHVF